MNLRSFGVAAALLLSGGGAWAGAVHEGAATQGAPTRLQHCQREVGDTSGDARKRALRDCLTRRNEGEAGVLADCRRQLHISGGQPSAAQQRQLRDCETRALAVPSQQLPRRPAPRVVPASAATPSATPLRTLPPTRSPAPSREGA